MYVDVRPVLIKSIYFMQQKLVFLTIFFTNTLNSVVNISQLDLILYSKNLKPKFS